MEEKRWDDIRTILFDYKRGAVLRDVEGKRDMVPRNLFDYIDAPEEVEKVSTTPETTRIYFKEPLSCEIVETKYPLGYKESIRTLRCKKKLEETI